MYALMARNPCENDMFADSYRAFISFKYLYKKKYIYRPGIISCLLAEDITAVSISLTLIEFVYVLVPHQYVP